jgi:hypothetical protein
MDMKKQWPLSWFRTLKWVSGAFKVLLLLFFSFEGLEAVYMKNGFVFWLLANFFITSAGKLNFADLMKMKLKSNISRLIRKNKS